MFVSHIKKGEKYNEPSTNSKNRTAKITKRRTY